MKKFDIKQFNPCYDALLWYESQPSTEEAWNNCHRGDWMLWIAKKLNVNIRVLTLAKGLCANTVRHLMKDERIIKAVNAAIAYGKGEIDDEELREAAYAADYATYAAAYAAYATYAAAAIRKQTADICREILTEEVFKNLNK
jgi:hypothetical protein